MLFATLSDLPDAVRSLVEGLSLAAQSLFFGHANTVAEAGGSEAVAVEVGLRGLRKARFIEGKKRPHEGPVRIVEALDAEGREWEVVLIKAGWSANGVNYTPELLSEAAPRYENAPAYAFNFLSKEGREYFDHLEDPEKFSDKLVEAFVGWYEDVRMVGGELRAKFHVAADWLRRKFLEAWEKGVDAPGFSHDVWAAGDYEQPAVIFKVDSVDVVTEPAAGGRIIRLVAGQGPGEERGTKRGGVQMEWERVLKILEARFPKLLEGVDLEKITDEQKADLTSKLEEAILKEPGNPPANPPANPPVNPPAQQGNEPDPEMVKLAESIKKDKEDIQRISCSLTLERRLKEAKFPEPVEKELQAEFKDRTFKNEELEASIKRKKETLDKLAKGGVISGWGEPDVKIIKDQVEKHQAAMDAMFEVQGDDVGKHGMFPNLREAYHAITGTWDKDARLIMHEIAMAEAKRQVESMGNQRLAESIDTTTFANLFSDSMRKKMIQAFQTPEIVDWRKVVSSILPLSDFKTQKRVRLGGYGSLPTVAERGPYTALTTPSEEQATYVPAKRGGTEDYSWEAARNDDLGRLREIPKELGLAAAWTLYEFVFAFFSDNPTIYDGDALFHANHSNLRTVAFSHSEASVVRKNMRTSARLSSGKRLMLLPWLYLGPPDLEESMFTVTKSAVDTTQSITGVPSIHNTMGGGYITVASFTDTNNWYTVANPALAPTIEIGFLDGKEEPEVFVQDLPNVGSMFNQDVITWKIRFVFGGAVLAYQSMHGNIVA